MAKVIYLRTNYHFGPDKISMYLRRYHDIEVSNSGVWRILKRLDLNRLPASQRYKRHDRKWKRYEKPLPGQAVQVDVKFIAPLSSSSRKKYYQFTAIDDCTRLRVLRIYDRLNQKTAIQFADFLLDKFPFRVEAIQTENGSEFQTAFHWHLADRGIWHIYIKPATPRLNGKVERSHRMDGEEFYRQLKGVLIDDTQLFNDRLQEWQDFYNYHRPHGAFGGQTPHERLRQKTTPTTSDVNDLRQLHNLPLLPVVESMLALRRVAQASDRLDLGRAWEDNGLIFTTKTGRPVEPRNLLRSFRRICAQNDLRPIKVHHLRHTTATLLKNLGIPARDAQLILGHSRLAVTLEIYSHEDRQAQREAFGRISDALGHGTSGTGVEYGTGVE